MKQVLTLLCCLVFCSISGLAQKKSSKPAMTDQQFVDFAGQTDMVDANLGQLARTAAPSERIKDYAQKLVTDQTNDFQQLSKAAHDSSLQVPNAIDKEHDRTEIDPLHKVKGTAFDHRFTKQMIEEDTRAIDTYKKEAAHAQAAALKLYAEEALPILQADLAQAKKMETVRPVSKKS